MSLFEFGGVPFGLADCKIARNNLNGTFGTAQDVPSVQLLAVNLNTVNADLEGDDAITSSQSKFISGTVTIRMGGVSMDVLAIILDQAIQSSGSSPVSRRIKVSNKRTPWFGVAGKADDAETTGDMHLFIPKCKVAEGFELRFEYGGFAIPELQLKAVLDSNFVDDDGNPVIMIPIQYSSRQAVALPPA